MKLTRIFIIAVVFSQAYAAGFRKEGFHFKKELLQAGREQNNYGLFEIDAELNQNSFRDDIRLVSNGKLVPYFIRKKYRQKSEEMVKVRVIFNRKKNKTRVVAIQLPSLENDKVFNRLYFSGLYRFESRVQFQIAPNNADWGRFHEATIYRYANSQKTSISLQAKSNNMVRLVFPVDANITISGASYRFLDNRALHKRVVKDYEVYDNRVTKTTELLIKNPARLPVIALDVTFKETGFRRKFRVKYFNSQSKRWMYFMQGAISADKGDSGPHSIEFSRASGEDLKVIFSYADNEPLHITSVEAASEKYEIVFSIPEKSEKISLYYGNKYIEKPGFDIEQVFDERSDLTRFDTGPGWR